MLFNSVYNSGNLWLDTGKLCQAQGFHADKEIGIDLLRITYNIMYV